MPKLRYALPKAVGTIRNCELFGDDYELLTNSQDIHAVLEHFNKTRSYDKYGSLFVKMQMDSTGCSVDYAEVWASWHSVAYLYVNYTRIA